MKPPRSLKIRNPEMGRGRPCVTGDVAVCHCICTRKQGEVVFHSVPDAPYVVRVGARDSCVGIEYGLIGMRPGGRRSVTVPPNLTYEERKTFRDIPKNAVLRYELRLIDLPKKWLREVPKENKRQH